MSAIGASQSASRLYNAALAASQPEPTALPPLPGAEPAEAGPSFTETMTEVAQDTVDTLVRGETTANAMIAGKADAQAVVEALAATEMALEMAVSIRDRVVTAYQEILRMPV
ncbi:MAG: flagellar hook-basal body complex protein FliE [Pseudomonadota bacterium]